MGLSDNGSYALMFCVTFLLVACLTVVTAKLFDRTPPLPTGTYAPPFPDAAPLLPPVKPAPNQVGGCVSYCTNSRGGELEPCESVALKTCSSDSDCAECMVKTPDQDIKCVEPTQWPRVKDQQAALNNKSDKYCLPTRSSCLNLPDDAPLQECKSNNDCLRCSDSLPNGERFQCQPTKQNALVHLGGKSVVAPYTASFCIPQYTGCDPRYGVATWTSDGQWKCECKYPGIMGGPACDQPVACNAGEVTEWSKDKQQLLLNMPGEDGSKVGDPWTIDSGVDPNKCIGADGKQVVCTGGATDVPTAACRCDGIHKGSLATYTFTRGEPLTCTQDPCYATDFGSGKTWLYDATPGKGKTELPYIPNLPVAAGSACSCSGFGSGVWTYEAPKDNTDPTQGYKWKGYCKEVTIPGTSIVLPADASKDVCTSQKQANTDAQASLLIPGVNAAGAAVCVVDPCSGLTSDKTYRTNIGVTGSFGHFNAQTGTCLCSASDGAININIPPGSCDRNINPACSFCANACIGGKDNITTLCPVRAGSTCSPACSTSPTGAKVCDCGKTAGGNQCYWYNGECVEQKNFMECCEDMHGVAGACGGENTCRVVRSKSTDQGCSVSTRDFVKQAIVCDHRDTCGSGWCGDFGKGPTCKCGDAPGCTTAHFKGTCGIDNPRN